MSVITNLSCTGIMPVGNVVNWLFRAETATATVSTPAIVITRDIIKHRRPHHFPAGKALALDAFHSH